MYASFLISVAIPNRIFFLSVLYLVITDVCKKVIDFKIVFVTQKIHQTLCDI